MDQTKPWYTSKTIWASAAAIIGAALSFFGMPFGAGAEQLLAERLTELATVIAGLVALYGRLTAEKRIQIHPAEPWSSDVHSGAV
ncbi:MAG: hypothetical protein AAF141_11520 [Pseudomonadota bacterium]